MNILYSAQTDIGTKKTTNQDGLLIKSALTDKGRFTILSVCDGMGGLSCGEKASATVIKAFDAWFGNYISGGAINMQTDRISEQWRNIIEENNTRLINYGKSRGIKLGTTCTVMLITPGFYIVGHVGDTREYEVGESIVRLTEDQTFVAREIREGRMTPQQAAADGRRNVLLQCIGASSIVTPQFVCSAPKKDTVYLICSDGFRHTLGEDEIFKAYAPKGIRSCEALDNVSRRLINLNIQRGEEDNISVAAVKCC